MIIPANKTVKPLELSGTSNSALETWLFKREKGRESEQSWSQFGILKFAYLSPQPIICMFGLKKTISSPPTAHTHRRQAHSSAPATAFNGQKEAGKNQQAWMGVAQDSTALGSILN